jgi:hypothetical protein
MRVRSSYNYWMHSADVTWLKATNADIESLGIEREHRTLVITRKGRQVVTVRSRRAPHERSTWPSARAVKDPSSWLPAGGGWTGMALGGSPAGPGSRRPSGRTRSGTHSSPWHWMPVSRCATCRKPLPTPTRSPPCTMTGPGHPWTGTPPTSSSPTSRGRPVRGSPAGTVPPGRPPARRNQRNLEHQAAQPCHRVVSG